MLRWKISREREKLCKAAFALDKCGTALVFIWRKVCSGRTKQSLMNVSTLDVLTLDYVKRFGYLEKLYINVRN